MGVFWGESSGGRGCPPVGTAPIAGQVAVQHTTRFKVAKSLWIAAS